MPQKLGKGGHGQQNYVPAGYGEASGTYGDNPTGSNKFVKFEKPNGEVVKQENKETKKEARTSELKPKQIYEIGNYVRNNWLHPMENLDRIVKNLRWYGGTFGDLSNFTDDELKSILEDLYNNGVNENTEMVYFKKPNSSKWFLTRDKDLLDKAGIKYYTSEEKEKLDAEAMQKTIASSQNEQDKKIQSIMGNKCTVCFGKGYNKDELNKIVEDTKILTEDFPELKDHIKLMGDRNNLEKLVNAQRQSRELTEEEIQNTIDKMKKYITYYNYEGQELEDKYRREAIKKLRSPISFTKRPDAYAYWCDADKAMIYMGRMKNFTQEQAEKEFRMNFKSSNKTNSVYIHELGHAADYAIDSLFEKVRKNVPPEKVSQVERDYRSYNNKLWELYYENNNKNYKQEFDKAFKEAFETSPDDMSFTPSTRDLYKKEIEKSLFNKGIKQYNLSRYGDTNQKEFIAESFAAYYTGMNNELANKTVDLMKNISQKLRSYL